MADSQAQYTRFSRDHYVPLHLQPWWLDAVCGEKKWNVCLASDRGGRVVGALPYFVTRRWGLPVIQQPPFTTYGGPWVVCPSNPDFKPVSRRSFEMKVYADLLRQLPRTVFCRQNFLPDVTNWLPFYWAGFRQTTRYTYLFPGINDLGALRAGFKNTLRTDLKKSRAATAILQNTDFTKGFSLYQNTLRRKGLRQPPAAFPTFQRLHQALTARQQVQCFTALDRQNSDVHAWLCLVFDARRASVLLTATDPAHKPSCAVYGLLWEALVFCHAHGLSLDFEGSMLPAVERTFRAFGGELAPYHQVERLFW